MDDPEKDPKRQTKGNTGLDHTPPRTSSPYLAPRGIGSAPSSSQSSLSQEKERKIKEIQEKHAAKETEKLARQAEKEKQKEHVRNGTTSNLVRKDFNRVR
jgi:hypothetical protein